MGVRAEQQALAKWGLDFVISEESCVSDTWSLPPRGALTRCVYFDAGRYRITIESSDGVRGNAAAHAASRSHASIRRAVKTSWAPMLRRTPGALSSSRSRRVVFMTFPLPRCRNHE